MASFTKRNGRWRARVRRSGLPPITKSFPTKASALKWTQRVESDPASFLTAPLSENQELRTVGDLIRKDIIEKSLLRRRAVTKRNTG